VTAIYRYECRKMNTDSFANDDRSSRAHLIIGVLLLSVVHSTCIPNFLVRVVFHFLSRSFGVPAAISSIIILYRTYTGTRDCMTKCKSFRKKKPIFLCYRGISWLRYGHESRSRGNVWSSSSTIPFSRRATI